MIALWLRRVLAAFAVVALAQYFGPHPLAGALGVIGLFLALNTGIVAASFAVSWRHAGMPAGPSSGLFTDVVTFLREWLAYLIVFVVIQPFERQWMRDDSLTRVSPESVPLLLIHGYMCNRGAWWWLGSRLRANGFAVTTTNLEPPFASIDRLADELHIRIETLCATLGSHQLALVAHSMGGLVARAYLRKYGSARVAKLLTLATPHQGTRVASYGFGTCAREMEPDSAWIKSLRSSKPGVPMLCLWSSADNFIAPQVNGRIESVPDKMVPALGHLTELFSSRVLNILLSELAHGRDHQR